MGVNLGAITGKLNQYVKSAEGQKRIKDKINDIKRGNGGEGSFGSGSGITQAGDFVPTYDQMQAAAKDLIAIIRRNAASSNLPESVMANVESFCDSPINIASDGSATISINMLDDAHRESLDPERYSDGIDNIVAAFNAGINAKGSVFGEWKSHGVKTWSKRHRSPARFMQNAVDEFNAKYSEKYNVSVTLSGIYE